MKDINKSIEMMPNNSYAYKIRALINIENKQIKLACQDLELALKLGYIKQFGSDIKEILDQHCK
ncbi:MAG: hypothetical protein WBO44_02745 [Saprospiraceae bacterium]